MLTYLPVPSFEETASILDTNTLDKQRFDTLKIMDILINSMGWKHHPAVLIWEGYEAALLDYQFAICFEWHVMRGFEDDCLKRTIDLFYQHPWLREDKATPRWLGDEEFHLGHQSALIRKDPEWYQPMFLGVPDTVPFFWPTDY